MKSANVNFFEFLSFLNQHPPIGWRQLERLRLNRPDVLPSYGERHTTLRAHHNPVVTIQPKIEGEGIMAQILKEKVKEMLTDEFEANTKKFINDLLTDGRAAIHTTEKGVKHIPWRKTL